MLSALILLACTAPQERPPPPDRFARRHDLGIPATQVVEDPNPKNIISYFARTVAPAGDVNGNGFGGVLAGTFTAYYHDVVNYLPGTTTGLDTAAAISIESPMASGTTFGHTLGGGADIDGDGYDDVLVGWEGGQVFVFRGSSSGLQLAQPDALDRPAPALYDGPELDAYFVGDIDADGFDDILLYEMGEAVHLYYGSSDGPAAGPGLLPPAPAEWGLEVDPTYAEPAGDVDGDGASDLVSVGFLASDGSRVALLYLGSTMGPEPATLLGAHSGGLGAREDRHHGAGDLNGDGYDDVVISDSDHSGAALHEGVVRVFLGSEAGPTSVPDLELPSPVVEERYQFGRILGAAGDVNGDGFDDLLVSSYDHVWLYPGGPEGPSPCAGSRLALQPLAYGPLFALSTAGDVDGDGLDDVVVGAEHADYLGRLHLFSGLADLPTDCPPEHIHTADTGPEPIRDTETAGDTALFVPGPREEEEEPQRRTECVCASGTGPGSLAGLVVLILVGLGRRRPLGAADV